MAVSRRHTRHRIAALLMLVGALGLRCGGPSSSGSAGPEAAPPVPTVILAHPGERVRRNLRGGDSDSLEIDLPAGWFLRLRVAPRGVDLGVRVFDPRNRLIVAADHPDGQTPDTVPVIARSAGRHRLEVWAGNGQGSYELRIDRLGRATERDRWESEAAVVHSSADRLRKEGKLDAAADEYRRAIGLWRAAEAPEGEVMSWRRLAQVQALLSRRGEEINSFGEALRLVRSLEDRAQEVRLLNLIGRARRDRGEWIEARVAYRQARALAEASGDRAGRAISLNNLAVLALDRSELADALDLFDQLLPLLEALGQRAAKASVLQNLGSIYFTLNRRSEAKDFLEQALALRNTGPAASDATALLGRIYAWQGERRIALRLYRRALRLASDGGNLQSQASVLDKMGVLYLEQGRLRPATLALGKAAEIFAEQGDRFSLSWTLVNQGRLLELLDRPQEALSCYRRAGDLSRQLGERSGEAYALYTQARAERRLGHLEAARAHVADALDRLDSLRDDAPRFTLGSNFFEPRRVFYELQADLSMELHRGAPAARHDVAALETTERYRDRSFLDALGESVVKFRQGVPADLLERESRLDQRINATEIRLAEPRLTEAQRSALDRELRGLLLDHDRLEALIRAKSPALAAIRLPAPLTADRMQWELDEDTTLLVYFLSEERSFLWRVDRHSIHSFVLPPRQSIEALSREAWELLSRPKSAKAGGRAERVLASLSSLILGPLAGELKSQRLVIVADGALRNVPFSVLPAPRGNPAAGRPLILDHEIVHLDSMSVLGFMRSRPARASCSLEAVALANPIFGPADPRIRRSLNGRAAGEENLRGLAPLPHSGREAEVLRSLVPGDRITTALGFAASRAFVLRGGLGRARIVHLATHGILHPIHPELSGLVFSQIDEQGRPVDGFLRAYEIFGLDLSAELVVLSACSTMPDPDSEGEGLVGVPRGFQVAGAPRVIVSLWNVNDRSTAELMERFYRGLFERRLRPAAALREAQISMLRERRWESPFYWAPFIFVGEWR